MELLNPEEWSILLLTSLIACTLLIINLKIISLNQKKLVFIHPGWLLNALILFYGLITPISLLFSFNNYQNMNSNFLNLYSFDNFFAVYLLYTLVLFIFTISEIILMYYLRNSIFEPLSVRKLLGWEKQGYLFTIFLLVFFLLLNIAYHISQMGGINALLVVDKVSRYEVIESTGFSIPYSPFYQVTFLFWYYYLIKNNVEKKMFLLLYWITFLTFSFFILYMGTTLQILMVIIGKIFIIFAYKRELILSNIKKIIIYIGILGTVILFLGNFLDIVLGKVNKELSFKNIFEIPDVTRFETVTGYLPGLVVLADENIGKSYHIGHSFLSLLPSSIRSFFESNFQTLTELIHESYINNTYGWYTITFPINSFATSGVLGVILSALIMYIGVFAILNYCFRRKGNAVFISVILFSIMFFIIRIEFSQWVGKLRLYIALTLLILVIHYLINILIRSFLHIPKRKLSMKELQK